MDTNKQLVNTIRDIFTKVRDLPIGDRAKVIADLCGGNQELHREVESLLQIYDSTDGLLQHDASGAAMSDRNSLVGTMLNGYQLIELIGEGGFGEVYRAEQAEPLHREVALKIIKLGMNTKNVMARFEAERQALARMNHPGIAQVYDAGITETGRPYFVMELVKGVPFIEYCDRHRLTLAERLALFTEVCEAVQHAHQKGILHRDLKPSNILVSEENGRAVPKIIDFGVAKSLHDPLTEQTLATLQEMLIGTPLYMSPEQLDSEIEDIDTRADIYSLGIILYELVAGTTPLEGELPSPLTIAEMRQALVKKPIPRPSHRFRTLGPKTTTIANERNLKSPSLERLLRGDLDWVVMKAIERERERRYADVGALAKDLGHYLNHEPVSAGPPSLVYRSRKFMRRHRMGTAVAASLFLSLLFGAFVSSIGFINARREAERARRQEAITEATYQYFVEELMDQADPRAQPDRDIKLRTVIDRAAERLDCHFMQQPLVCARVHRLFSSLYSSLGEYPLALEHAQKAVLLVDSETDDRSHPERLASMHRLAGAFYDCGRDKESEKLYDELLQIYNEVAGPPHADALQVELDLSYVYMEQSRFEEAENIMRRVLKARKKILGTDDPLVWYTQEAYANLLMRQGRNQEAIDIFQEALAYYQDGEGAKTPDVMDAKYGLGRALLESRHWQEAEVLLRDTVEMRQRVFGPEHPGTLHTELNLVAVLVNQGKKGEAAELSGHLVAKLERVRGPRHQDTLAAKGNHALAIHGIGKKREAEDLVRDVINESLPWLSNVQRDDWEPDQTKALDVLFHMLWQSGTWLENDEVVAMWRELLEIRTRIFGAEHADTLNAKYRLSWALTTGGQHEEAEQIAQQILIFLRDSDQVSGMEYHPPLRAAISLVEQKKHVEAEPYARIALELQKQFSSYSARHMRDTASYLAVILCAQGKSEEAVVVCREMVAHAREYLGPDDKQTFHTETALARSLLSEGSYAEAEELCRLTLLKRHNSLGMVHPHTQKSRRLLVEILRSRGKTDEADELEHEIQRFEEIRLEWKKRAAQQSG